MKRFGLFQLGRLNYAIALLHLRKIVQDASPYPLPRLPLSVSAVLIDGGNLIPLLNLELFFGAEAQTETKTSGYQVMVESEYGTVALPADLNGRIVTEKRGAIINESNSTEAWVVGEFNFQNIDYKILDINFLAIEITQNFWLNQSDSRGVRRHP
jgi:chemotaxis signal transduction protein